MVQPVSVSVLVTLSDGTTVSAAEDVSVSAAWWAAARYNHAEAAVGRSIGVAARRAIKKLFYAPSAAAGRSVTL